MIQNFVLFTTSISSPFHTMPQVDSETLVSLCASGSNDFKIPCETLPAAATNDNTYHTDRPEPHPDSPPESFWLSRDEEYDWWDRNAVYERKESTKGNSNSIPNSTNLNPNNSNSQRFSRNRKSKPAIIGLPMPQKPSFVDAKNRLNNNNKFSNTRLFPKRSASVAKSESSLNEPSSPKVSCMGRVRSKRDRNRRLRSSRRSSTDADNVKPARTGRKPGFFESVRAIFRAGRRHKSDQETNSVAAESTVEKKKSVVDTSRARHIMESVNDADAVSRHSVSESEPPGLGGMMRLASGRRSEPWGVGESEINVAQ